MDLKTSAAVTCTNETVLELAGIEWLTVDELGAEPVLFAASIEAHLEVVAIWRRERRDLHFTGGLP